MKQFNTKITIKLILLLFVFFKTYAQEDNKKQFFPSKLLFKPLIFDPIEAQAMGAFTLKSTEGVLDKGSYAPFEIGFNKPIYQWNKNKQLALDVAVFTQFDMFSENKKFRRYMRNADYKISLSYVFQKEKWQFRLRGFHVSSHLGDDYLVQNGLGTFKNNQVNYEQIDLINAYSIPNWRIYGGLGYGIRPSFRVGDERRRLAFQAGFVYEKPLKKQNRTFIVGIDNRILAQNQFYPGSKIGVGYGFLLPNQDKAFYLLLEGYNGHTPYGKFEAQQTRWLGIGFSFQP